MTLEVAAQFLTTALLIIQSVSANPSLPQSTRDQAQTIAQQAITEATRAIAKSPTRGASVPSCTITADKPNYFLGEVILFSWTTTNAAAAEFIPDTSGRENLQPPDSMLGARGVWRKAATVKGYPFVTMKVTDRSGHSATCSTMVYVY